MAPKVRFPLTEYAAHLAGCNLSKNAQRLYVASIRHLLKRHPEPDGAIIVTYAATLGKAQRMQFEAAWARYCDHLRAEKRVAGSVDPATQPPPLEVSVGPSTDSREGESCTESKPPDNRDLSVIPPEASSDWVASDS